MTSPILPISTTTATTASTDASSNVLTDDDFMKLLLTQLQNQDPTNPMDPSEFVGQLVQFNSLDQLIAIRQLLTPLSATSATGNEPSAGVTPTGN